MSSLRSQYIICLEQRKLAPLISVDELRVAMNYYTTVLTLCCFHIVLHYYLYRLTLLVNIAMAGEHQRTKIESCDMSGRLINLICLFFIWREERNSIQLYV